jgi:shikimate kinase
LSARENRGTVPCARDAPGSPERRLEKEWARLAERKKDWKPERLARIREAVGARSIVLIGLMGAGKTAVGKRLAALLELPFTDADSEIELAAGQTVSEIFTEFGEPYFRQGEARVIARLLQGGPQVLATGGGAYMDARTRANVKAAGISIWLKADLPVLLHRVRRRDNRPLLASGDPEKVMRELMKKRYPVYGDADITVESREVPHDVVVADVVEALARWLDGETKAAAAKGHGKSE